MIILYILLVCALLLVLFIGAIIFNRHYYKSLTLNNCISLYMKHGNTFVINNGKINDIKRIKRTRK